MEKRVCIFVDGENFRRTIVSLFKKTFNQAEYLPKRAKWDDFFDWLSAKHFAYPGSPNTHNRIRTYWYVIEQLDIFPWSFPKPDSPEKIRQLTALFTCIKDTQKRIDGLKDEHLRSELRKLHIEISGTIENMENRFDGWRKIQDDISMSQRAIEFHRAGAIHFNAVYNILGSEKAVDVKLATDLILLKDVYDIAVIVSGDQDYVPAVKAVKDFGKQVANVYFTKEGGDAFPGGARRLNETTDDRIGVTHDELNTWLFPK